MSGHLSRSSHGTTASKCANVQVTQHDDGWSSAQLTLLLYGWDGRDDSLANLLYCLPFARAAPRVTLADKSARLVTRAAGLVTPRPGGGGASTAGGGSSGDRGSPGRSFARRSESRSCAADSSAFDDASSFRSAASSGEGASGKQRGGATAAPRRSQAHENQLQ